LSKETSFGLKAAEKIFGVIIMIIGIITTYNTYNNMNAAELSANIFIAVGIVLIIIGLILITIKTK